jgi:hypothetical protein
MYTRGTENAIQNCPRQRAWVRRAIVVGLGPSWATQLPILKYNSKYEHRIRTPKCATRNRPVGAV